MTNWLNWIRGSKPQKIQMQLEKYEPDQHYKILQKWWEQYEIKDIAKNALPDTGYVCYKESQPIGAGFCYYCAPTTMALLSWFVVDNDESPIAKVQVLHKLAQKFVEDAKSRKCDYLVYPTSNPTIQNVLKNYGFNEGETGLSTMILPVSGAEWDCFKDDVQ